MAIGHEPIYEIVVLVPGQDFIHEITPPSGETFAVSTDVDLIIYNPDGTVQATWAATVNTTLIRWQIDSVIADSITQPATYRIYVRYSDGVDLCWYRGAITWQR